MARTSPEYSCQVVVVITTAALLLLLGAPRAGAAVTDCNTIYNGLVPCYNYIVVGVYPPPSQCCSGIRAIYNSAASPADRQAICYCLKNVAGSATPAMLRNAAGLPGKCGINIPYTISPKIDCSKVG